MKQKKKSYNPFKMSFPYIMGLFLVLFTIVISFFKNMAIKNEIGTFIFNFSFFDGIMKFVEKVTPGDLYSLLSITADKQIYMLNPLVVLTLFAYGFLIGYLIQSFFRAIKKRK